jgi:hypothetical protein
MLRFSQFDPERTLLSETKSEPISPFLKVIHHAHGREANVISSALFVAWSSAWRRQMERRSFIALLGGAAAWPLAARAQQSDRVRRIGALMNLAADDPEGQARLAALLQRLQELGWIDGRNVRIDTRWTAGNDDRFRTYAAELVAFAPDVILAATAPGVTALQQATRTVPIAACPRRRSHRIGS